MREVFLRPEASNRYDVILRFPFLPPFSVSDVDWFWVINKQFPPILGNAGPNQSISTELVQAGSDFCFRLPFEALLGFGLDIVFFSVAESSLLSLNSIVGREGGSIQFFGSGEDAIYIKFKCSKSTLDIFRVLPSFNVRFMRYGVTWWEGEASLVDFAGSVLEAGSKVDVVSVTILLKGKQMATVGPAIGMFDFMAEQEITTDLMCNEADWNFRSALNNFDLDSYYNFSWYCFLPLEETIFLTDIIVVRCALPSGWGYRKSHVVGYAAGAGVNYQKRIRVHYGSGTDNDENVYCGSHCKADFGDVRFTCGDGLTLLDYWLESKVDGDCAVFWVEVADDLSAVDQTIYIYYGNAAAATKSNGVNTFPLFNDASIAGWDQTYRHPDEYYGPATVTVEADYLKASGTHGYEVNVYFSKVLNVTAGQGYMLRTYRVTAVSTDSDVAVTPVCGLYYANGDAAGNIVGASWTKLFSMTSDYTWHSGTFTAPSETITLSEQSLQHDATGQPHPQAIDHRFRNIILRKYVSPEPADGAWGSEEILN